jgi:hypothetical protein
MAAVLVLAETAAFVTVRMSVLMLALADAVLCLLNTQGLLTTQGGGRSQQQ